MLLLLLLNVCQSVVSLQLFRQKPHSGLWRVRRDRKARSRRLLRSVVTGRQALSVHAHVPQIHAAQRRLEIIISADILITIIVVAVLCRTCARVWKLRCVVLTRQISASSVGQVEFVGWMVGWVVGVIWTIVDVCVQAILPIQIRIQGIGRRRVRENGPPIPRLNRRVGTLGMMLVRCCWVGGHGRFRLLGE